MIVSKRKDITDEFHLEIACRKTSNWKRRKIRQRLTWIQKSLWQFINFEIAMKEDDDQFKAILTNGVDLVSRKSVHKECPQWTWKSSRQWNLAFKWARYYVIYFKFSQSGHCVTRVATSYQVISVPTNAGGSFHLKNIRLLACRVQR